MCGSIIWCCLHGGPLALAMGVSNTCDEGAQCAQVANIGPIVDAPPFMAGEDVHTQKMQDPEIRGVAYQPGTLLGYEVREYLLDKWDRRCAYCDTPHADVQIDHVYPKSLGDSDRVSNVALACPACNASKDNQRLADFLAHDPGRPWAKTVPHSSSARSGKPPASNGFNGRLKRHSTMRR